MKGTELIISTNHWATFLAILIFAGHFVFFATPQTRCFVYTRPLAKQQYCCYVSVYNEMNLTADHTLRLQELKLTPNGCGQICDSSEE